MLSYLLFHLLFRRRLAPGAKVIAVLTWRCALVEEFNGRRYTVAFCFLIFG